MSFNRGVNEFNRGVNELNRGVNRSVARQGCNLLRAAVTSQGCCCGNLQIHPLDLGQHHRQIIKHQLMGRRSVPTVVFIAYPYNNIYML